MVLPEKLLLRLSIFVAMIALHFNWHGLFRRSFKVEKTNKKYQRVIYRTMVGLTMLEARLGEVSDPCDVSGEHLAECDNNQQSDIGTHPKQFI